MKNHYKNWTKFDCFLLYHKIQSSQQSRQKIWKITLKMLMKLLILAVCNKLFYSMSVCLQNKFFCPILSRSLEIYLILRAKRTQNLYQLRKKRQFLHKYSSFSQKIALLLIHFRVKSVISLFHEPPPTLPVSYHTLSLEQPLRSVWIL